MPRFLSPARLAAAGLAIAAMTIIALAALVLADLGREAELHHEVILAQELKDRLHALRANLQELRSAARLGARTGDALAFRGIERRSAQVEAELAYLHERANEGSLGPAYRELVQSARLLVVHARSVAAVRGERGADSATFLAQQADRLAAEAVATLDRTLDAQTLRINERSLAQLRLEERLQVYVSSLLAGSIAVLVGLFAVYRRMQLREREAQQRIERLAHFDLVTGLPNRALMQERLAQETARARRGGHALGVLAFDLDGFKGVNDTWGHAAGDRILAEVGKRSRACLRTSDVVGRVGGDEFVAILPETDTEGAIAAGDKLRAAIREPYPIGTASAVIGASVGVSLFPLHGNDPDALLNAADAAMYRAKREGRDRTIVAADAVRMSETPAASAA